MKTFVSLLAALSGLSFAATPADPGTLPEGIAASDWSAIRAAHDAGEHAVYRQEDGHLVARNPGQQWRAEFDGKGFTITPDHGAWSWGLDLTGYGDRTLPAAASPSQLRHEGGKITCKRDENLTEWFVNDTRGLEQGWDIRQRPERADPAAPLQLQLSTRGSVRPQVSASGDSVSFLQDSGGGALTYGGLKAWDADGQKLSVRFEQAGGKHIRIAVDDRSARYPITIDPVAAQQSLLPGNYNAIGVSGDTVVIGARVFTRSGGAWAEQALLAGSNAEAGDGFGSSVAISGDTVVIGATGEDSAATGVNGDETSNAASNSGAVYVFTRSGTVWTQQAYLKASNTGVDDAFGSKVAISGDTIVVGTTAEDSNATGVDGDGGNNAASAAGAAYVFSRSGTTWTQQAYLKASNAEAGDGFGVSVAVSGDTVVVGANWEDSSASGVDGNQGNGSLESGAAYVFVRNGMTWTQQAYLKAVNTRDGDWFGSAVAVSGDTVVVGAQREDSSTKGVNGSGGAGYYEYNWAGAAYIFVRNGSTWSHQAFLKASNTDDLDQFGISVAISGDTVAVGANWEDSRATGWNGDQSDNVALDSGAVYIFTRSGTTWTQQVYLKVPLLYYGKPEFGRTVAVSDGVVLAGSLVGIWVTDFFTSGSEIHVKQGTADVFSGGTTPFGPIVEGTATEFTFTLSNLAVDNLFLTGTPKVALTGSSEFTVSAQPTTSPIAGYGASTPFKVRFAPTSGGIKTASLSIASSDVDEGLFTINLAGTALSFTTDTDGDGLNDAAEFNMATLNFNWQAAQPALVDTYFGNAGGAGLKTLAQIQALHPGTTLIAKSPASGRFKVTTQWKKSTDLVDFFDFPAPAGSAVSISPSGKIEFEFAAPEKAAFFRIGQP